MKVLITGIDGYLGWSLAQHLATRDYQVCGIDNTLRRKLVEETNSRSVTPISDLDVRSAYLRDRFGEKRFEGIHVQDLSIYDEIFHSLKEFQPDAIVYLGEIPSAPYSMKGPHEAAFTQINNIIGTLNMVHAMKEICPEAHLVKLGTMGEYGTPNVDIPEGFFELEYRGRKDCLMFPRKAGSWYHQSKVHDTNNVEMACRFWGLRSTDIMQGVVYGTQTPDMELGNVNSLTRFDVDQYWGTAINRFCGQAVVGLPITPFGGGNQKRGFLPLRDSMQCIRLILENPPERGEYRTINQFEEVYTINELAENVQEAASEVNIDAKIRHLENPRMEAEEHYYNPDHQTLLDLGYQPTRDMHTELIDMLTHLQEFKPTLEQLAPKFTPDLHWTGEYRKCEYLND